MKFIYYVLFAFLLFTIQACSDQDNILPEDQNKQALLREEPTKFDIVQHYAPIVYQDIDPDSRCGDRQADGGRADYITKVNFDNNYKGNDNWENLPNVKNLKGALYWTLSESSTHYFITYTAFHPRDWVEICFFCIDQHENDMEGTLIVARKGEPYGPIEFVSTIYHNREKLYVANGTQFDNGVSGSPITFENGRVSIFIESKGHAWNCRSVPSGAGDDYIKYTNPANNTVKRIPTDDKSQIRKKTQYADYTLINMTDLWNRRNNRDLFEADGSMVYDGCGGANAPWRWASGGFVHSPILYTQQKIKEKDYSYSYTYQNIKK